MITFLFKLLNLNSHANLKLKLSIQMLSILIANGKLTIILYCEAHVCNFLLYVPAFPGH